MISITKNSLKIDVTITSPSLSAFFNELAEDEREKMLEQLLEAALTVRNSLTLDMETQTIKKSVDEAKSKLEEHFEAIKEAIAEHVTDMTDPEKGVFRTLFDEAAKTEFENALDSNTEGTPIYNLKESILEQIGEMSRDIELVMLKLRIKGLGVDARQRGTDFEKSVLDLFDEIAAKFLDTPIRTGDSHDAGSTSKKGDGAIVVQDLSSEFEESRIAIEVKTDKQFKKLTGKDPSRLTHDEKIRIELKEAMRNRKAKVGIFVLDDQDLDMQSQVRWKVLGKNQLVIILDSTSPDLNFVELAYAWARWQLAKESKDNTPLEGVNLRVFDPSFVEEELNSLVAELDSSRDLTLSFGGLQSALNATREKVAENQASVASKIRSLIAHIAQEKILTTAPSKRKKT
jgi:hypothetical protein